MYLHGQVIELLMEWRDGSAQNHSDDSTIFSLKNDLPYDDRVVNKHFKELINKLELPGLTLVKLMLDLVDKRVEMRFCIVICIIQVWGNLKM